jgi:hypothetical protein
METPDFIKDKSNKLPGLGWSQPAYLLLLPSVYTNHQATLVFCCCWLCGEVHTVSIVKEAVWIS